MDNADNLCARLVLGIMLNVIISCSLGIYESQISPTLVSLKKKLWFWKHQCTIKVTNYIRNWIKWLFKASTHRLINIVTNLRELSEILICNFWDMLIISIITTKEYLMRHKKGKFVQMIIKFQLNLIFKLNFTYCQI